MGDPAHLEKMGRELKCPICLSLLNSAVSLNCNHVFCNECVVKSMKSESNCPVCKVPYRRREIRAAPHMDNLVSIYKSMELASGFNIFVTQNATSTKLPGEPKEVGDDANCGKQDVGVRTTEDKVVGRSKRKGKRKNDKSNEEIPGSVTEKPSFPAKKRVQVPKYPLSETTMLPQEKGRGPSGSVKDGLKNSSQGPRENLVVNEEGKPALSPFFWLRDEDVEKPSQSSYVDQLLEITPPNVPTFSDMKDSDDENHSKTSPTGVCEQSNVADLFDSELFEWTQRPCSPEIFPSPVKMPESKLSLQSSNTNEDPTTDNEKYINTEQGTHVLNKVLPGESSMRASSNDNPIGCNESKKRGRSKMMLKKCAKKNQDSDFDIPVDSNVEARTTEREAEGNKCGSLNLEKINKRTKKAGLGTPATEANQNAEMIATEFAAPSSEKQDDDEDLKMKRTRKTRAKISPQCQTNQSSRSKRRKITSSAINMSGDNNATHNHRGENADLQVSILSDHGVAGRHISAVNPTPCKNGKEVKSVLTSESNQESRYRKHKKVSFNSNSEDGIATVHHQECNGDVSAIGTQVLEKVDNLSPEEKEFTVEAQGCFDARINGNPVTSGGKCKGNAATLSCRKTQANKIQCAFCLSSEETEASGEMVHYCNGRPVAADSNDGHKMIHSHKNCTEWAPNVYFEGDIAINLEAELARSRRITCCCCGLKGAALGCYEKTCRRSFHVTCAKSTPQCRWDCENFVMLCPLHVSSKLPNENAGSQKRKKRCIPKGQTHIESNQVLASGINTFTSWGSNETRKKLAICCSALTVGEKEMVSEFEKLSGITVLKNWDLSVTHVIASTDGNGSCRRTLKILMGILEGKWILNVEWVRACMKAKRLVPEEQYEITADIHGIRDGPRLGRLRLLNKDPKIFEGYKFYFMGDFIASYKGYIQDLLISGGGTVLHRKPISESRPLLSSSAPSTFIIYSLELPDKCDSKKKNTILNQRRADAEALANATGARAVSNSWVLNSIAACKWQNLAE
ncbi:hypothetical protein Tsubulata_018061 [Turnera subulata]|uniref:RING-type E3 ubiquitin transferase BRCA1 n=1 Tax=Turnera subulata TaxID=218843 RepID=A0A9Q0F514_9ROSI|nr:hypothetical protein Tsubulata_018061 [Turnera subulata]